MRDPYSGRSRRKKAARRRTLLLVLIAVLLAALIFFVVKFLIPKLNKTIDPNSDPAQNEQTDPGPEEPPEEPGYDYTKPVPESQEVTLSYFDDAVFIGTSRTQGLIMYNALSKSAAYATKGLSLAGVFDTEVTTPDGLIYPIPKAVEQTDCSKIYVMLGMNDMGYTDESTFGKRYGELIDVLKKAKPDAVLYIQSVLPLTQSKEQSGSASGFTMERVNHYNDQLKKLCAEKEVYYVDVASSMTDENGYLPEEAASDGIHLTPQYCKRWLAYLQKHVILPEDYNGEFDVPMPQNSGDVPGGYPPTSESTDVTDFTK